MISIVRHRLSFKKKVFCSFGRDQTCAMLLGLASGSTYLDNTGQSATGTITAITTDIANVAKQAFYDFGERPMWAERVTYGTSKFSPSLPRQTFFIDTGLQAMVRELLYSVDGEKVLHCILRG